MNVIRALYPFVGVAAVLALAGSATAAAATMNVEAHDNGTTEYWFTKAGETTKNPTLEANPGDSLTVVLVNKGLLDHNWEIATSDIAGAVIPYPVKPNETKSVTFTVPNSPGKSVTYYCLPHQAQGMKGTFKIAGSADTGGGTPGFEVALALGALVAVALVLRARRR